MNDSFNQISIDTIDDHLILMWKIQDKSVLIVIVDKSVSRDVYFSHIEDALEIIEQGLFYIDS